jgi:hypothetical protein
VSSKVKFKDVPVGGRIDYCNKVWVVMENYGDGLLQQYTGKNYQSNSVCSFVDINYGITLNTEVNFIN